MIGIHWHMSILPDWMLTVAIIAHMMLRLCRSSSPISSCTTIVYKSVTFAADDRRKISFGIWCLVDLGVGNSCSQINGYCWWTTWSMDAIRTTHGLNDLKLTLKHCDWINGIPCWNMASWLILAWSIIFQEYVYNQ